MNDKFNNLDSKASQSGSRLLELDSLRGIAACLVMWFHYTVQYDEMFGTASKAWYRLPYGNYGVHLFFVISGFVIFLTLSRTRSWQDFAFNRFSRLYPAYWVCIALTFLVTKWAALPGLQFDWITVLKNTTMLQYWMQSPHVDGVYWTLGVELVFYTFVIGLFLCGWLQRAERWVAAWLVFEFLIESARFAGFHLPPVIRTSLLLGYGHFFFAGVIFYRIASLGHTLVRHFLLAACVGMAWFSRDLGQGVALALVCVIFLALIHGRLGWLVMRPLLFLGQISYPLYLLHQYIGYAIIAQLKKSGHIGGGWLLVPVLVSLGLALLVNLAVEKPARTWLRRQYQLRFCSTHIPLN